MIGIERDWRRTGCACGVVGAVLLASASARACIVDFATSQSGPDGPPPKMEMASENALIVWDEASHTEHFIRQATFEGNVKDFAFLVPTPSVPDLVEVDRGVFERLEALENKPDVIFTGAERFEVGAKWALGWPITVEHYPEFVPAPKHDSRGHRGIVDFASQPETTVEVLKQQTVAGYEATVLRAEKADDLARWLADHGYPYSSTIQTWLVPYVRDHWVITAYKIDAGAGGPIVPKLVRMTFKTDRAVYPYREPDRPATAPHRTLRLHLVSAARMTGRTEEGATSLNTTYARASDELRTLVDNVVPAGTVRAGEWLTGILDSTQVRPHSELYFSPDANQSAVYSTITDSRTQITELRFNLVTLLGLLVIAIGASVAWRDRKRNPVPV